MTLQTSYFNKTVLKKDLTRFAPLWVLYTLFWLLRLSTGISLLDTNARIVQWAYLRSNPTLNNFLYAGLAALLLFGDLYNSRRCNGLHAMPLRREGWFLTHSVSALLFALIPYTLAAILTLTLIPMCWDMVLVWWALTILQFLFFFGVGTFCVMCAGNRLGMSVMSVIVHFFCLLAMGVYSLLYEPLLAGVQLNVLDYTQLIPTLHMSGQGFFGIADAMPYLRKEILVYLLICLGSGLVFWILSIYLYRRRKLECAGDLIAVRAVAPIFLVLYTLAVGIFFRLFFGYGLLIVGLCVGFFTGKMLLQRTAKVFNRKSILAFVVLLLGLVSSMYLTYLDPAGITRYQPADDQIADMRIYSSYVQYIIAPDWIDDGYWFSQPEDIRQQKQLHRGLIENELVSDTESVLPNVIVEYRLTNGKTVRRYYNVSEDDTIYPDLDRYFSRWENVLTTTDLDRFTSGLHHVEIDYYNSDGMLGWTYSVPRNQFDRLMQTILAECEAGNLKQTWLPAFYSEKDAKGYLLLRMRDIYNFDNARDVQIALTSDAGDLLAFLNSVKVPQ